MKINNLTKICFALVALSLVAVYVFKLSWSSLLPYAIFLLCPLMHFMMMKDMDHGKDKAIGHDSKKSCH